MRELNQNQVNWTRPFERGKTRFNSVYCATLNKKCSSIMHARAQVCAHFKLQQYIIIKMLILSVSILFILGVFSCDALVRDLWCMCGGNC